MEFIAGGMESDDSDYDTMVFTNTSPKHKKKFKNPDMEFVAVSAETVAANGNFKPPPETIDDVSFAATNNFKTFPKAQHRRGQGYNVVTRKNEPLDDLRYAIIQGNFEITKSIIEGGVKADCVLKTGWTGLMYACSSAHDEIVQYLLENGANPNYNKDFFTPLMAVCASTKQVPGLLKCCQHLLKHKAAVNVHERHLTTPLMFAAREGHFQIIKELLEAGADVTEQDNQGRTALMWAASCGNGQIVRLLLTKGADTNDVDSFGQTAADLAMHYDFKEISTLLEKHSVTPGELPEVNDDGSESESRKRKNEAKMFPQNSVTQHNSRSYLKQNELEIFLKGLGLTDLIASIKEHELTFDQLLVLSEEELEKLGIVKIGVRKQILEAAQAIHKEKWKHCSLSNVKKLPYISCPDAVAMVANIDEHLEHISAQIIYIRLQIQKEPQILELSQDTANVHNLLEEADNGLKYTKTLYDELRFLKLYLHKIQGNTEFAPADLIEEPTFLKKQSVQNTKVVFGVLIITVTIGGILWKKPDSLKLVNSFIMSRIPFLQ